MYGILVHMSFFVIHISVYVDIGYLFVDAHLKINTFYTFVMLGFMDTFLKQVLLYLDKIVFLHHF